MIQQQLELGVLGHSAQHCILQNNPVVESGLWTQGPSHIFLTLFIKLLLMVSSFLENMLGILFQSFPTPPFPTILCEMLVKL